MDGIGVGLVCPIGAAVGGGVDEVHRRSMEWAHVVGFTSTDLSWARVSSTRFGELASRAYPDASVADRVLITGWLMYIATLDDFYETRPADELTAIRTEVDAYVRGGRDPRRRFWRGARSIEAEPLFAAVTDLWPRTAAQMTAPWRVRFGDSLATFLDGVCAKARARCAARRPTLGEYLPQRRATSAGGLLFDLIQLASHQPLPDAIHFHSEIDALRSTATDIVAWINDLASVVKEEAVGADHNLVLVVRRTGGLSASLARAVATDMVNDGIRRLWHDSSGLPDLGAGATAYVNGLKSWVRANIDWSACTGRYRAATADAAEARDR